MHNLPVPLTPFVGRRSELRVLQELLRQERLISVIGPGGCGKTRLVVQAAWNALGQFTDGVWLVPLVSVASPDLFSFAIGEALQVPAYSGLDPQKQVANYLRGKHLLLVLDNFEQLVPAAGLLTELLQQAPRVTALVTSRQRLNLYGEHAFNINGLDLPQDAAPDALVKSGAGQLFLQNAQRAQAAFCLTPENSLAVQRICQLVEGMPLALELAGAWTRAMSCEQIAAQIERDLDFLSASWQDQPVRRRSMRALLEHSWGILAPREQQILRRLSVLAGRFDLPAAQAVAQVTLPELVALVDKSLLHWEAASERYESHLLLKRYAAERLAEDLTELAAAGQCHSKYFLDFVYQHQDALRGHQINHALHEIGEAISDMRQAWNWALEHHQLAWVEAALEGLYRFYETCAWFQEGASLLETAASCFSQDMMAARLVWKLRTRQALLSLPIQVTEAQKWLPQGLDAFRLLSDQAEQALCLYGLARLEKFNGHLAEAKVQAGQAAALAHSTPNSPVEADSLLLAAEICSEQSQYAEAEIYCEQALQAYRRAGNPRGAGAALWTFGAMHLYQGDHTRAEVCGRQALEIFCSIGDVYWQARALDLLGGAYTYQGRFVEARPYQERALSLWQEIGGTNESSALNNLAFNHMAVGDFDPAQRYFEQALRLVRESGKRSSEANMIANLAYIAHQRGDEQAALEFGQQAAQLAEETGHSSKRAYALGIQAGACLTLGQLNQAEALYRQVYDLQFSLKRRHVLADALAGLAQIALQRGDLDRALAHVAAILPAEVKAVRASDPLQVYLACAQVWRASQDPRLPELIRFAYNQLQEMLAQIDDEAARRMCVESFPSRREVARQFAALQEEESRPPARAVQALADPLTRQEIEVLRLLAEGLTNQQIAARLVVTVGTAKTHIHNLYRKLGAQNRTQAVARGREISLL